MSCGGSYGKSLISQLSGNTAIDVLINYNYNQTTYIPGSTVVNVSWDFMDYEGAGLDVNGNTYVDPFITLGHELLHAQNIIEKNVNMNTWFSHNGKRIPYEEHVVSVRENYLRYENGIPLRRYYAVYDGTQKGYIPSIINNPRCLFNIKNK